MQNHVDKATSLFMKLFNENKNQDEMQAVAASVISQLTKHIKEDIRDNEP